MYGVLEALAGLAGAGLSFGGQAAAAGRSSRSARHARAFSEHMSATAFQRATKDMRAAGINPILAAGSQASTPSPTVPEQRNIFEAAPGALRGSVGRGIATAKAAKAMDNQLRTIEAEKDRAIQEARRARSDARGAMSAADNEYVRNLMLYEQMANVIAERSRTNAQTQFIEANTGRTMVDRKLLETELPSARALEELYEEYPWLRKLGAALKDTRR